MSTKDFEDKVLPLSDRVYGLVARMLGTPESAEDAVQEIMIKLWDHRKKLGDHPNIPGFVFLTARNYCLDLLKKRNPNVDSTDFLSKMTSEKTGHNPVEWEELITIIENLMKELPAQQCEVLQMRDLDGLEFIEIAAATKLNVEHVRVLLSRARKKVSLKLKNIYSYE